jgi:HrpA-like RNA helicase
MTAAGQSALNVRGLDTVVIYDARYGNVVERGRNVLHRLYLGANEILQMAGRVHGRVQGGEVTILSDRDLKFDELRPTPPEFQLAGDAERVAITCAAIGVDAAELDLPVPLDRVAYRRAAALLNDRGLVENGRLTTYGRQVEALPVERPWGELLTHASDELLPFAAVCANIESLHRMTRAERDLHGVVANGSDHLTAYNLYAEAVNQHGYIGEVYGLPRHLFEDGLEAWAERRGVLVKSIEDIALGTASVYRSLELPLPKQLPYASKERRKEWTELIARIMPFDLVIDEHTADGESRRLRSQAAGARWPERCASSPIGSGYHAPRSRGPRSPTTWCGRTPGSAGPRSC